MKNVDKFDKDCRNSGTIKHCIDIQDKGWDKQKTFSFNEGSRVKKNER